MCGLAVGFAGGSSRRNKKAGPLARLVWQAACAFAFSAIVVLLLVRILCAPTPLVLANKFPVACYPTRLFGNVPADCVRVAPNATVVQLAGIVVNATSPLFAVRAPLSAVADSVDSWVRDALFQSSLRTLAAPPAVLHATIATPRWGFVDDLYVLVDCDPTSGTASVLAHSEQRLGSRDFGVNARRVRALREHLAGLAWPALPCDASMP